MNKEIEKDGYVIRPDGSLDPSLLELAKTDVEAFKALLQYQKETRFKIIEDSNVKLDKKYAAEAAIRKEQDAKEMQLWQLVLCGSLVALNQFVNGSGLNPGQPNNF